ncbi:MAG: hypothetical protein JO044_12945, partial [Mycobacteriaceae bacterium]|nr:hypothetical protein [Mycobacteriaceae bacterium]
MAAIMGTDSKVFEHAVTGAILVNAAVFGWGLLDHAHRELAEHVETAILVVFAVELVCRLRAAG